MFIRRRGLLNAALAAPALLARPATAQPDPRKVIRSVPIGDLRALDPIWTTAYITRNHGYLIWDTLFALDARNQPQPQMVGAYDASARIPFGMVQSQPGNLAAVEQLASIFSDAGDAERLAPAVARLRAQALDRASTHYYSATLAYLQQRPDVAIREAEAALQEALLAEVNAAIRQAEAFPPPPPESLFEDVYARLPWHLEEQRSELQAFLRWRAARPQDG